MSILATTKKPLSQIKEGISVTLDVTEKSDYLEVSVRHNRKSLGIHYLSPEEFNQYFAINKKI